MCNTLIGLGRQIMTSKEVLMGPDHLGAASASKAEYKPKPATPGVVKKVLHLTDIHLDCGTRWSAAKCNEPLCCRIPVTTHFTRHVSAWFGTSARRLRATPLNFVIDSLKQMPLVIRTSRRVTGRTFPSIICAHYHTVSEASAWPSTTSRLPVWGNHECNPINLYIPEAVRTKDANQSMTWLYNTLTAEHDYWAKWLDTEEIRKTFHRMFSPSWKVIVLNSNVAQKQNFWILYNPVDPDGQLAWLISELDHAEKTGAKVTILGHVPPRHENYDAWVHNYIRIVDRYQDVIASTYYGHTHKDEWSSCTITRKNPFLCVLHLWVSDNVFHLNPQYHHLRMDSNGTPLDSTVYLTDMDEANARHKHDPHARPCGGRSTTRK
ncbi:Sphingomyelin phosphodiesterase, partial [Tyrophagus putrescentiae]